MPANIIDFLMTLSNFAGIASALLILFSPYLIPLEAALTLVALDIGILLTQCQLIDLQKNKSKSSQATDVLGYRCLAYGIAGLVLTPPLGRQLSAAMASVSIGISTSHHISKLHSS